MYPSLWFRNDTIKKSGGGFYREKTKKKKDEKEKEKVPDDKAEGLPYGAKLTQ